MGLAILCHLLCLAVTSSAQCWADKTGPDFSRKEYHMSQVRLNSQENTNDSLLEIFILLPEVTSCVTVTFTLPLSHWSWILVLACAHLPPHYVRTLSWNLSVCLSSCKPDNAVWFRQLSHPPLWSQAWSDLGGSSDITCHTTARAVRGHSVHPRFYRWGLQKSQAAQKWEKNPPNPPKNKNLFLAKVSCDNRELKVFRLWKKLVSLSSQSVTLTLFAISAEKQGMLWEPPLQLVTVIMI